VLQVWFLAQYCQPKQAEHARRTAVLPEASGQHSTQMAVYFALPDPSFLPPGYGGPTSSPMHHQKLLQMHSSGMMDSMMDADMINQDSSAPAQTEVASGALLLFFAPAVPMSLHA
jgi:hypothetical protein